MDKVVINRFVYFKGNKYNLYYKIGKKKKLEIKDNDIIITGLKYHTSHFRSILFDFYKKEVEKEIINLMLDVEYNFKEVKMPKIKVKYLKNGLYGTYNKIKNEVTISSFLAKLDFKYIKVVLYHEFVHLFEMSHNDRFFEIFEDKFKDGPSLDDEFKKIKLIEYL